MPACKSCGGEIVWKDRRPMNLDGSEHWEVCKQIHFSKVREGTPYRELNESGRESGYVYQGKRHAMRIEGKPIIGLFYRPSCGACGLPPWIECACSFGSREQEEEAELETV